MCQGHGAHSVSSVPYACGGSVQEKILRYLDCSGFTGTIMMDLQKEFSEVFVARIAKQKDHHDTELFVTPHLIWIVVLSIDIF